jgi:hypothetical protein
VLRCDDRGENKEMRRQAQKGLRKQREKDKSLSQGLWQLVPWISWLKRDHLGIGEKLSNRHLMKLRQQAAGNPLLHTLMNLNLISLKQMPQEQQWELSSPKDRKMDTHVKGY